MVEALQLLACGPEKLGLKHAVDGLDHIRFPMRYTPGMVDLISKVIVVIQYNQPEELQPYSG